MNIGNLFGIIRIVENQSARKKHSPYQFVYQKRHISWLAIDPAFRL
jgi:hypothetical protein